MIARDAILEAKGRVVGVLNYLPHGEWDSKDWACMPPRLKQRQHLTYEPDFMSRAGPVVPGKLALPRSWYLIKHNWRHLYYLSVNMAAPRWPAPCNTGTKVSFANPLSLVNRARPARVITIIRLYMFSSLNWRCLKSFDTKTASRDEWFGIEIYSYRIDLGVIILCFRGEKGRPLVTWNWWKSPHG